jgi:diguanylate cyclase (GGDEF)-like protein
VLQDLTPRKAAEEEIRRLAYFDSLTNLPNRRLLLDRLAQAQVLSVRNQQWGAVLMLDLDNFKTINDTQGPEQGDRLLCAVAQRLRASVHEEDTLARLGGDEFVLVMTELGTSADDAARAAEAQAQALLAALQEPLWVQGQALHSSISIGISVFQGQGQSVDELLQRCDIAMYQAKTAGRNTLRFYDPQMQVAVTEKAALEADMRTGLQQEQFVLYFQPQVDCGRIVGAEVLLRWQHPIKGFVPPGQFIPLAESGNLIVPLGQWVLRQACATLARWAALPELRDVTLAVNVSPRQFYEEGFVEQVRQALDGSGAPPQRLKLELTEGILLQDIGGTIGKMEQLRRLGVSFSLDDFGTGYSSLAYLKRLPLQELKIDQSFVRDVLQDANDAAIARTIIALAQSLNLQVTAEGVESEEQRHFLERSGCHAWQGYLLSPPVPVLEFEALLLRYNAETHDI